MFYIYLIAAVMNVFLLALTPWTGISEWLPMASGGLCLFGMYNHRKPKERA